MNFSRTAIMCSIIFYSVIIGSDKKPSFWNKFVSFLPKETTISKTSFLQPVIFTQEMFQNKNNNVEVKKK